MDGIGDVFIGSVRLTLLGLSILGCPFLPLVALMESELTRISQLSAKSANQKNELTFIIVCSFFSSQGITIRPLVEFLDVKRSNKKQPAVSEEIYNRVCCSLSIIGETLVQMKFLVTFRQKHLASVLWRSCTRFLFDCCNKHNNCKTYI